MASLPLLVLALVLQAPAAPSQAPAGVASAKVDPKLHADATELVEVTGVRKRILDGLPVALERGKKMMMESCPTCTQNFGEEWAKRMAARYNVDDMLAVYVAGYEKYLTDPEILELIQLQRSATTPTPGVPSDALKTKLAAVIPNMLPEIMGGCSTVGAKLGMAVGTEIQTEHPEYMKATPPPAKP